MLKSLRRSLSTRLMAYFMIAGLLFMVAFAINFFHGIKVHFQQEVLPNIAQYLEYVVDDIGAPPDLDKARTLSSKLAFSLRIDGPEVDWTSHARIPEIGQIEFKRAPAPFEKFQIERKRGRNYVLMEVRDYCYLFVIGRPFEKPFRGSHHRQQRNLLLIGFIVVALGALFLLIRSSLRPMAAMQEGIRRIAQGELDNPINPPKTTEFRKLAEGINDMAGQIRAMLEGKRELLLAISHELRSPITRAKVNLALMPDSEAKDALLSDCDEMEQLVTQILESERLNQKHAVLHKTEVSLDELVSEVVDQYFSQAGIELELNPVSISADRNRLTILVKNLLDNALKYSRDAATAPRICVGRNADQVLLEVEDSGQGMSDADLSKITQAFYRVDPARARDSGGVGLGLYLCQLIVEAHGGEMRFSSELGTGTRVTVSLPLIA